MMDKTISLISSRDYVVPNQLILNFKKIGLNSDELIILIYLINNFGFNPKKIGEDLELELNDVMEIINNLVSKNIISLEMKKINNIRDEYINLDPLYKKLAFQLIDDKKQDNSNIFDIFEREFGRTLSPMEYEIINTWIDNEFKEDVILMALKEATYNGVSNLRYIDKILYEWQKKGIKTQDDVLKNKKIYTQKKVKTESFDYDWLNNE